MRQVRTTCKEQHDAQQSRRSVSQATRRTSLVWEVILLPKKRTEVTMIATRLTTLHTPCATGVTRDSVLNANCGAGDSIAPQDQN